MRLLPILILFLAGFGLQAQDSVIKPAYCEESPNTYGAATSPDGASAPSLPRFATTPTKEYKVQVAILRYTDPAEYPFHPTLVARYRPCEQVWVIESRESFAQRADAESLQQTLQQAGYGGTYITDLVAYN